ncbi:MAG: c-type cytochrome domain-containing protein [Planctomycetota bacterium]
MTLNFHSKPFFKLVPVLLCLIGQVFLPNHARGQRSALDEEGRLVDFNRDIAPIFRQHCYQCHNENDAKADFQVDDPDIMSSYVEPEDLESSTLYVDYLLSDDPEMMMPPPGNGGPLSAGELSLIRVWIEEGADWPEDADVEHAGEMFSGVKAEPEVTETAPRTLFGRVWVFQGFFHPATVHFPIALFLFGALFVVLGFFWRPLGKQIPLACLLIGAPTAFASTTMGWALAAEEGYGSWAKIDFDSEVFWHRWSGVIVSVVSMLLALIALGNWRKQSKKAERTWKVGLLVLAGLVGLVGHQGGELKYGSDFYPRAFRILLGQPEETAAVVPPVTAETETAQDSADDE